VISVRRLLRLTRLRPQGFRVVQSVAKDLNRTGHGPQLVAALLLRHAGGEIAAGQLPHRRSQFSQRRSDPAADPSRAGDRRNQAENGGKGGNAKRPVLD
jgi:hypothetical protein